MGEKVRPEIVVIAAVAKKDRLIGDGLDLPWRISEDLKRFKRLTLGHPIVMGRRTFDSLVHQFGGVLKGRPNLVLTSRPLDVDHPDVHAFSSLSDAIEAFSAAEIIFLGGGASVYEAGLPIADRLELTLVDGDFTGDTYFPPFEHLIGSDFSLVQEDIRPAEGKTPQFAFNTYVRVKRED